MWYNEKTLWIFHRLTLHMNVKIMKQPFLYHFGNILLLTDDLDMTYVSIYLWCYIEIDYHLTSGWLSRFVLTRNKFISGIRVCDYAHWMLTFLYSNSILTNVHLCVVCLAHGRLLLRVFKWFGNWSLEDKMFRFYLSFKSVSVFLLISLSNQPLSVALVFMNSNII